MSLCTVHAVCHCVCVHAVCHCVCVQCSMDMGVPCTHHDRSTQMRWLPRLDKTRREQLIKLTVLTRPLLGHALKSEYKGTLMYKGTFMYKGMPLQVKKADGGHIRETCMSSWYAPCAPALFRRLCRYMRLEGHALCT